MSLLTVVQNNFLELKGVLKNLHKKRDSSSSWSMAQELLLISELFFEKRVQTLATPYKEQRIIWSMWRLKNKDVLWLRIFWKRQYTLSLSCSWDCLLAFDFCDGGLSDFFSSFSIIPLILTAASFMIWYNTKGLSGDSNTRFLTAKSSKEFNLSFVVIFNRSIRGEPCRWWLSWQLKRLHKSSSNIQIKVQV